MNSYSNYVYSAMIKATSFIYFFLLIKISSNYLEAEKFGELFLIYNGGIYISSVFLGQQSAGLLRFYHELKDKYVLYKVIAAQVFFAVVACICVAVIAGVILGVEWVIHVVLMTAFGLVFGVFALITSLFRARGWFRSLLVLVLIQSVTAISILLLFGNRLDWMLVIAAVIFSFSAGLLFYYFRYWRKTYKVVNAKRDPELNGNLLRYGIPIVLVSLFNLLLSSSDQFVLKYYSYSSELGVYAANYSVAEKAIFTFLSVVTFVFVPSIFRSFNGDHKAIFSKISKIVGFFVLFSFFVFLIFYFFSYEVSLLLTSPQYASGHKLIPLTAIGCTFLGVASFYSEMLTVSKKTKLLAFAYFGGALFNLTLNFLFVKEGGIYAAVYTSIVSYFLLMLLIIALAYSQTNREFIQKSSF